MNNISDKQKGMKTTLQDTIQKQNMIYKKLNLNIENSHLFNTMKYNLPISCMINENQFKEKCLKNAIKQLVDMQSPLEQLKGSNVINNLVKTNFSILPMTEAFSKYLTMQDSIIANLNTPRMVDALSKFSTIQNTTITSNMVAIMGGLIKSFDLHNLFSDYLLNSLEYITNIFEQYDFGSISKISGLDSKLLDKYYWVIPYEYDYAKLQNLSKYKTRAQFEKYMIKYFNDNRVRRLFIKIRKHSENKDKKVLMKQIESSFFNGDYAICITSLITMLDGLTLQLLEPNSDCQHLSYKAINAMLEYIKECQPNEFSYELYLKVNILNNFYIKLYENEKNFKTTKKRMLSRHINSHGIKYLNKKVEVLRLLNAIYFCQQIIEETSLQEQFTKIKKDNKFVKVPLKGKNSIN